MKLIWETTNIRTTTANYLLTTNTYIYTCLCKIRTQQQTTEVIWNIKVDEIKGNIHVLCFLSKRNKHFFVANFHIVNKQGHI